MNAQTVSDKHDELTKAVSIGEKVYSYVSMASAVAQMLRGVLKEHHTEISDNLMTKLDHGIGFLEVGTGIAMTALEPIQGTLAAKDLGEGKAKTEAQIAPQGGPVTDLTGGTEDADGAKDSANVSAKVGNPRGVVKRAQRAKMGVTS